MSKKTRKKVSRRVVPASLPSKRGIESKSTILAETKKPAVIVKTYYTDEELKLRYAYVTSDLKRIALIAVPMILALIISSWFVKF
jgi:hypothetical protein